MRLELPRYMGVSAKGFSPSSFKHLITFTIYPVTGQIHAATAGRLADSKKKFFQHFEATSFFLLVYLNYRVLFFQS